MVESLTPKDDADEKGVVIEVRAGTGIICTHFILSAYNY
jgi:protein subunit release factor A